MSSRTRQRLSAVLGLGVAAAGLQLVVVPASVAASTGLIISEFYGNGGNANAVRNADFIELYNPTSDAIDLAGTSVQYRSGGGTAAANGVAPLSGTVQPGKTFLVRLSSPTTNGTNLPAVDLVASGVLAGGTNGLMFLANGTTAINPGTASVLNNPAVIDLIGFGTANTFETAAATGVSDNTRSFGRSTQVDGDNNSTDFAAGTPTPTNAAGETAPATIPLGASDPGDKTGVVGTAIPGFTLAATGGTAPYTWTALGLPPGIEVAPNGAVSGTPTTAGVYDVTATATDSATPTTGTDEVTFTYTIAEAATVRAIAEIQGTGATSPYAGTTQATQGVVTALYPTGGLNGMFIQTPGADTDGASDGLFVYGGPTFATIPGTVAIGDSVQVTGAVSEFNGSTQITPASAGAVTELVTPLGEATARPIAYPTTEAGREVREGELLAPTDTFTVSNAYATNQFAEIGLATGTTPLRQPTELVRDDDAAGLAAIKANNAARAVTLDDASTLNFLTNGSPNQDVPLPWLSKTNVVRVGAEATFHEPVVLEYRNSTWKFQPTERVTGEGTDVVTFEDTRTPNAAPAPVGGDLTIATFNVLNYFNTTGQQFVANGGTCSYYSDRDGNPIGSNTCTPNGPRGAATAASLQRQQAKIVTAINTLGADVVGLEEMENSLKLLTETNRDDALAALVTALNAATGAETWDYVHSPAESTVAAAVAEQDVIRPAFIYRKATVTPVGQSDILFGTTEFANAREPLAQAFKPKGALDAEAFAVIVNHFKSKGDSDPVATGDNANSADVGAFNGDRTRQATRLAEFAAQFADARGIEAVFLAGDFNSYTHEDPMHVLYESGYEAIESDTGGEESYSFGGLSGSLDHVLGNSAAMAMVTGADIWDINAAESAAYQYSRFNYNATEFFDASNPFAASDHNPEIVGIDVADFGTDYTPVQIIATNDFHGRLLADGANAAGAATLAGAVKELRAENPNTVFAAAGDLIGASTFESFIQNDVPTIDALNEAGLEVSAAGNHEFDRGYEDLVGRVQDRADWEYIAANVVEPAGRNDLAEAWTRTFGDVEVGFVGAVTEDLPSLVSPSGIQGVTVTDVVEATNAAATQLKADGADLVVLLVHEGSPTTGCASMTDPATAWGHIVTGVSADVDAIVSGHTHLAYNCSFPESEWVTEGRAVTERPVVSAGQYGTNLNQLVFTFDNATGDLVAKSQDILGLVGTGYPVDGATKTIVDEAKAQADVLGAVVLGQVEAPFNRARLADGTTENRGGESTLGNLVAEVQQWATESPEAGAAQIAFMNPGGLRADMAGTVNGAARDLTYKQAAVVQPFANTLVNMDLTGANIKLALEQQWQRDANDNVPSRPFLRLGVSEGFTYTFDKRLPEGSRITGMWLEGEPIDPSATYSVTVNSFLASGGDNFRAFANGTGKADTGKVDLQAMVDYMEAFTETAPLAVDHSQRAVGIAMPNDAPASYSPGDHITFGVSSWTMSTAADVKDTEVQVMLGEEVLGTATLDNTIGTAVFDDHGTAAVDVVVPEGAPDGRTSLTLVGARTGTTIEVPVTLEDGVEEIQVLATNDFHGRIQNDAASASAGAAVLAGAVEQLRAANPNTVFAAAGDLIGASTFESFIQNDKPTIDALNEAGLEVSAVGNHELDQGYDDLVDRVMAEYDAEDNPEGGAEWQYIAANLRIKATGDPAVPATWVKTMNGVDVGFVGAVTEDLPALVSPDGIAELQVDPIVSSVNAATADLKEAGAEIVVMLVHEGAPTTTCATMTAGAGTWANIVNGVSDDVDAIVSGHTHLAYNCSIPVAGWSDRPVTERPVVSAGQYGTNLNQLVLSVDTATGEVVAKTQALLPLKSCANSAFCVNYPADPATTSIVSAAVAQADVLGAQKLGELGSSFSRAKLADGTIENRGGESTLGNLVAEVQRWATRHPESGSAQIAFMNPGGLRADMIGTGTGAFPRDLTYKQAAVVQPFANTLVNLDLTGAQIETILEQQWQRDANNKLPSRPFLRLGSSAGFTYTYSVSTVVVTPTNGDPAYQAPQGEVIGMWLDGEPIDPTATYSVTANSFLASGGDNFRGFNAGTGKQDTGKVDLQAMVDYMAAASGPVAADPTQHSVGVNFPADAPASYAPGDEVAFTATSLAYTAPGDLKDLNVTVWLGNEPLRTIAVDNTIGTATYDEHGTAPVTFVVPPGTPAGLTEFRLVGNQTGTEVPVTIEVDAAAGLTAEDVTVPWGEAASVDVAVTGNGRAATGTVEIVEGDTVLSSTVLVDGAGTVVLPAGSKEPGEHVLTARYSGDDTYPALTDELVLTVEKASTTLAAEDVSIVWGTPVTVTVALDDDRAAGTVELRDGTTVLASAPVVDGVADLTVGSLEPGVRTLTAAYAGSGRFESASTTVEVEVRKASTTLSAEDVSTVWGTPVTVTVALDDDRAAGTVELRDGTTVLASAPVVDGVADLTVGSLEPGVRTLTAAYAGSGRFEPASTNVRVEVRKATTALSAGDVSLDYGTAATVTVTLDKRATGAVELMDGATVLATANAADGTASLTLPAGSLRPGSATLTVSYAGSGRFQPASTTLVAEVDKAASTTRVRIKQDRVVVSRTKATITIAVLGDHGVEANGKVRIAVSGQAARTVRLDDGSLTLRLDEFNRTGKKTVTVRYLGSNLLGRSDDTVTFRVVRR